MILKRQDIGRGRLMLSGNWLEETRYLRDKIFVGETNVVKILVGGD